MLRPEDNSQITARGSSIDTVKQQITNFISGFPPLKLIEAAGIYHGLIVLSESEVQKYAATFDDKISNGLNVLKFVPASGAASRMFKSLFSALEALQKGTASTEVLNDPEVSMFANQIDCFAFYDELIGASSNDNQQKRTDLPLRQLLDNLLSDKGLNYGNLPKGLLIFHRYQAGCRTAAEEHFVEGAAYSKDTKGIVSIHFTVSPEHQQAFEKHVNEIKPKYEKAFGVVYQIGFSQQKSSTDTISVTPENEPFRNDDGSLLFRPAGHGALLENLNDLDADLIFIKNVDNVVPDHFKKPTIDYKKALAGVLLNLQEQIFYYQKMLQENLPVSLESGFYAEAANFLENVLNVSASNNQYYSEKEELHLYFSQKFNRPIRVCGMVKNQGEPGGGPFFAVNNDGTISLQIAESSQIDFNDPEQSRIAKSATHFNPVDLVCAVRNYAGVKFNLMNYTDPNTGFISTKSKDGKELKAQELPGLWNGSMADWNTLFVEVPIETFNPVKTVNDLLRKEHQSK
jgi:hypothetical protein